MRHEQLAGEGAISQSVRDTKRLTLETSRQQVKEAQANLSRINNTAKQQLEEAQANLDRINGIAKQ